jgi:hypothetical protein
MILQHIVKHFEAFFQFVYIAKHTFNTFRISNKQATNCGFKSVAFEIAGFGQLFDCFTRLKNARESDDVVVPGFIQGDCLSIGILLTSDQVNYWGSGENINARPLGTQSITAPPRQISAS